MGAATRRSDEGGAPRRARRHGTEERVSGDDWRARYLALARLVVGYRAERSTQEATEARSHGWPETVGEVRARDELLAAVPDSPEERS
jgi:hypothetical protein